MLSMLQAHGLDSVPTHRPLLAGAVAAVIADLPATAVLGPFGSLEKLAHAAGIATVLSALVYGGTLLLGGMLYGWLFQRAANDPRGGWLFGLAFGFVLWMLGPVPVLQWLADQPILRGYPAAGLLLAELLWGLAVGLVFPLVHRHLHVDLENRSRSVSRCLGP